MTKELILTEVIHEEGSELIYKGSSFETQIKNIRKNRTNLNNIFNLDKKKIKTHFIKNIHELAGNKSQFYIHKNNDIEINSEFNSDNETIYFNFNEYKNKNNKIYYQETINIDGEDYVYKFRPVKLIKNYISFYRDVSILPLLIDEGKFLKKVLSTRRDINPVIDEKITDSFIERMSKVCNIYSLDDVINFIEKNKYFTVIYEMEVLKFMDTEYIYDESNVRILIKKSYTDEELIRLFDDKKTDIYTSKNMNTSKNDKKINKKKRYLLNKKKKQIPLIDIEYTTDTNEDAILEIMDIDYNTDINTDTEKELRNDAFEIKRPHIWINKLIFNTTSFIDKKEIYRLLNELYRSNENYKQFLIQNNYLFIEVIKSFHLDKNKKTKSLHINLVFKQDKIGITSNVFHAYIDNELNEITGITELNNVI